MNYTPIANNDMHRMIWAKNVIFPFLGLSFFIYFLNMEVWDFIPFNFEIPKPDIRISLRFSILL